MLLFGFSAASVHLRNKTQCHEHMREPEVDVVSQYQANKQEHEYILSVYRWNHYTN